MACFKPWCILNAKDNRIYKRFLFLKNNLSIWSFIPGQWELQIRGGMEANSKIILLVSQREHYCDPSSEQSCHDDSNEGFTRYFSFEKYRKLSLNYPCYPYLHVSGARGHNIQSPRAKILKHCPWSFFWMCSLRFNPAAIRTVLAVLSASVNSKNLIKFELLYIWLSILQGGL